MQNKILVSGYPNPDLDATACAIAYAEYLQKKGEPAFPGFFGSLHQEAEFVLSFFAIPKPDAAKNFVKEDWKVVLVDASDLNSLATKIQPSQVIEIIDHRIVHEADKFPGAKVQIERVGSAATLIAEKFFAGKVVISTHSAVLLYSAIISNTVNFQADVTTDRDKKMVEWLLAQIKLPADYIHQMFAAKSHFDKPLKAVLASDFASFSLAGHSTSIIQLEIINVTEFVKQHLAEITQLLTEIKLAHQVEYLFISIIDIEQVTNTFVVIDDLTRTLLERMLNVSFTNGVAKRKGIIMRKSLVPLIKNLLA